MPFNFAVQLNDPANAGGSADPVLVYDLQQALSVWSQYIVGLGTLKIELDIANTQEGRESGGPTSTEFVGTTAQGVNVFESSAFYELTTGNHVTGTSSDITITIDPGYFQNLDLSSGFSYGSTVASNHYNPVIVFLHEIMHGFGMTGYLSQTGTLSGNAESPFDLLIQRTGTNAFFTGSNAEAAYGGPIPLTTNSTSGENYYHFGNQQSDLFQTPTTVHDPLTLDLMNGIVLFYNYQYQISSLDLGVLRDLGYTISGTTISPSSGDIADFNSDGKADILIKNADTGQLNLWEMNGTGIIAAGGIYAPGPSWDIKGVSDLNGDGKPDILLQNTATSQINLWEMNGYNIIGAGGVYAPGLSWHVQATADFNGDGKADILVQNTDTGR